ncbi:uncharacterized protein PG986_005033 [Apiospora aurea]|uniref:Uncharacterized protein n=1 Tax=Apiospora aurea TaxID=335848 RepID=A0ABR1QHV5_9PEZI
MADIPSPSVLKSLADLEILLPADHRYGTRERSYHAANARLAPSCIARPRSAPQVASLLQELASSKTADIAGGGVTVGLGLLDTVAYDAAGGTVRFGAGARWRDVYGELANPDSATDQIVRAVRNFTQLQGQGQAQDSYLMAVLGYFPDFGTNVGSTAVFQAANDPSGPEFDDWRALPKIVDMTKETSMAALAEEITLPANYHDAWFTLCIKNDERIMKKATDLHETLVAELKAYVADGNFITNCIFQPVPCTVSQRTAAAGGNIMGTERIAEDAVLFQLVVMTETAEQARWAHPRLQRCVDAIRDFAAKEDVIGSYGAENVEEMRRVAIKYDPDQVFQKLCPGGWKIPGL